MTNLHLTPLLVAIGRAPQGDWTYHLATTKPDGTHIAWVL